MTIINLTTPMSDDKERQRQSAAMIAAIEQYTEERMNDENTNGSRSGGQPVLLPCPHCGEQCADLMIDQGDKWAHYSASCLEVRTGYNISDDAPWRAEAIAAYNKRQPTQGDDLRDALSEAWQEYFEAKAELAELERNRDTTRRFDRALDKKFDAEEKARRTLAALQGQSK